MVKDCNTVWQGCLETIKLRISEKSFNTWFAPIKPKKLQNNVLTIEVPSPFFYEWLEEHFIDLLKAGIDKELGPSGKLEYSLVVDKGGKQNAPINMDVMNVRTQPTKHTPPLPKTQVHTPAARKTRQVEVEETEWDSNLKEEYSFDNFVEGASNAFGKTAGLTIAERPGKSLFNPLFMYGGVGVGKTHLAQAIGNEILRKDASKKVLYITADQFISQFIEALRNNAVQVFTNHYLKLDVLIIDDIQFLSKKEKTQENFFHIFNHLHGRGKQIIMTSDKPPRDIVGFQERLLSRFKWGVTAEMEAPDVETRTNIVKTKLKSEGVDMPNEIIDYVARSVNSNVRELEGVLLSMIAQVSFGQSTYTTDLAKKAIRNIVTEIVTEVTVDDILEQVSAHCNVQISELKSKSRKRTIAHARQMAMFLAHTTTKTPLKVIGEYFGGRDHSTVIHASKCVKKRMKTQQQCKDDVHAIAKQLRLQLSV